jgi:hypothetical protein
MEEPPVSDSPLIVIRELAKQFKGTVSTITLYDANVCSTTHPPGRSWEFTIVSGEPFSKQLLFSYCERKIRIFANRNFLHLSIAGSFPAQPLSVNERNLINPLLKEAGSVALDKRIRYSLFTEAGVLSPDQKRLLGTTHFRALLRDLDLQREEKLNIFSNEISAYLKNPTAERVTRLIDGLAVLENNLEIPQKEIDLTLLPRQFHPLIPLMKKWAISDDSDRENFLENLPKRQLERFVMEVEPYLRPIDSYLDSFGGRPPSEQACALGRLAECAVEAKRSLEGARGPD